VVTLVVLYRGDTAATARPIASDADPRLVAAVADAMLERAEVTVGFDPVMASLERGRFDALRIARAEAEISHLLQREA
jgi:hypothetical protein